MPAAWKMSRASCSAAPPIQLDTTRCGASRTTGTSARAMSALGTMAVGACMNSSVPASGAASSVRSVCT
jgi:hypothetical protein